MTYALTLHISFNSGGAECHSLCTVDSEKEAEVLARQMAQDLSAQMQVAGPIIQMLGISRVQVVVEHIPKYSPIVSPNASPSLKLIS